MQSELMDIRLQLLLSEIDQEEAGLLKAAIQFFCSPSREEISSEELSIQFENFRKRIKEIESKALRKIEARKLNPVCSFCQSKASEVKHMLQASSALNICGECITTCHNKLEELE